VFERFVEEAVRSILDARDEARKLQHGYVGTEHMLLGLAQNDRKTAGLLSRSGRSLDDLRAAVGRVGAKVAGELPPDLPFSSDAQRTISVSWSIAEEFHHNTIVPLHLLGGMLRIQSGQAFRVFEEIDLDVRALAAATREALTPAKVPADRSGYLEEELGIHTPYGQVVLSVLRLPGRGRDEARIISIAANHLNGPQEVQTFLDDFDRLLDASSAGIPVTFFRDLFAGLGRELDAYLAADPDKATG